MRAPARGLLLLTVAGVVTASLLISPVGAALNRREVKKIAAKISSRAIKNLFAETGVITKLKQSVELGPPSSTPEIAGFALPPGTWVVMANVEIYVYQPSNPRVECDLVAEKGTGIDERQVRLFNGAEFPDINHGSIPLVMATHVPAGGSDIVHLFCSENEGDFTQATAQIVAFRANGAISVAL